jgi:hypothetical protein
MNKYKRNYSLICDELLVPLYTPISHDVRPIFFDEAKMVLRHIGNWYIDDTYSYIRVYGVTTSPHLLPNNVPNRELIVGIAYQTILHGFKVVLVNKYKKRLFIPYNFCIELNKLINFNYAN